MKQYLLIFIILLGAINLMAQTVFNLVATGSNIQWYHDANGGTPLATSTPLENGHIYYASQTVNGVESTARLAVTATLITQAAPAAATHTPAQTQVAWNWAAASGATGYKWNTTNDYGSATDTGTAVTKTETSLTCNIAYTRYVWAYNASGCVSSVTTLNQTTSACEAAIVDGDGNVYTSVTIGTQVWLTENLKTTSYNDHTAIPNVTDGGSWAALSTPAYCWYNNDANTYKDPYGALYNWYVVSAAKNVCPIGWHIPSYAEWTILTDYLGGTSVAGGKLKETGTTHWNTPNTGATNETGFTALPMARRQPSGLTSSFYAIGNMGYWWSTKVFDASQMGAPWVIYNDVNVGIGGLLPTCGVAIRCLKD